MAQEPSQMFVLPRFLDRSNIAACPPACIDSAMERSSQCASIISIRTHRALLVTSKGFGSTIVSTSALVAMKAFLAIPLLALLLVLPVGTESGGFGNCKLGWAMRVPPMPIFLLMRVWTGYAPCQPVPAPAG